MNVHERVRSLSADHEHCNWPTRGTRTKPGIECHRATARCKQQTDSAHSARKHTFEAKRSQTALHAD
jgi:hypothetical protein